MSEFEILSASDGLEALEIFNKENPFLVLTGARTGGIGGLELLERIKAQSPRTLVVVMAGEGSEGHGSSRPHSDGPEDGKEPLKISLLDIRETVSLRLYLGNDPDAVKPAAQVLTDLVEPFFNDEEASSIKLGLFEIILNAIEHGSLEIDYRAKTEALENNSLKPLIQERRDNPDFARRDVKVEMRLTKDGCQFTISDQGPGFEWRQWIQEDGEPNFSSPHGRGILLARFSFDKVAYNEQGNEVTLEKKYQQ